VNAIGGQRRDTLTERLTERRDRRPAGNERQWGSHIPAAADQQRQRRRTTQTDMPLTGQFLQTSPVDDVDNGAGEVGAAGDVFSHTGCGYTPCPEKKSLEYFRHNFIKYWPIFEIL